MFKNMLVCMEYRGDRTAYMTGLLAGYVIYFALVMAPFNLKIVLSSTARIVPTSFTAHQFWMV